MSYSVRYSSVAADDLFLIYEYVALELSEPQTALNLYKDIAAAVDSLADFPLRHPLFEDEPWRSRGLRKMTVKNFLVFYTADEENLFVNIIRIMYGARDISEQLKGV